MNTTQPNTSRKRSSPPSENENEDDMVDQLLPAAAAMKRRKIEEQENFRRNGVSSEATSNKTQPKAETEKRRKPKNINIQEVVRERREAEEEAARRDEESLRSTLDGMNIEEMKNLAIVEEMKLPDRSERHRQSTLADPSNNRWDESWNGRKNFKKFRRRGESTQARRGQSVIVPLAEVKKKDFGIGEEYWLGSDKPKNKRKDNEHISQDLQSQSYISARSQHEKQVPTEFIVEDKDPTTVDVDAPRTTRRMDRASQLDDSNMNSQARNGKRPAPIGRATTPVAKKQKVSIPVEEEEESDSGDELRFRFKSRK